MVPLKYITKRCLALDCWTEAGPTVHKLSGLQGINFSSSRALVRLPTYPSAGTGRKSMRPVEAVEESRIVAEERLIDGAGRAGALCATGLAGIYVAALACTLRPSYIGECFLEGNIIGVDAVAEVEAE
jgi:hypothetical protein